MRPLLLLALLTVASARADELPDAGLPDASVGQGGADRDTEENDTNGGPCVDSRSCVSGFECVDARCVPAPIKNAGCSTSPVAGVLALALWWRRARR